MATFTFSSLWTDPKLRKKVIIAVIFIVVTIGGYWLFQWWMKNKAKNNSIPLPPTSNFSGQDPASAPPAEPASTSSPKEDAIDQTLPLGLAAQESVKDPQEMGYGNSQRQRRAKQMENQTWDWAKGNDNFSLKLGSAGERVKVLQQWLNEDANAPFQIPVTGKFEFFTESALKQLKSRDHVTDKMWKDNGLDKLMPQSV